MATKMRTETPETPIVAARNISRSFKDFWGRAGVRAVRNLSFDIRPGEIFGLLGPNGSGKSTTLKMLLGLLRPDAGAIRIFGLPPGRRAIRARLGYLPEENHMYPQLTPMETLDFYARLFNLDRPERRRRIRQLLDMTGLREAANRPVGGFSKGMTRRIGLAQALINDPDLVILDEPASGLDPPGRRQVKDLLLTLSARGKTIILSSHLLADVEDVCQHILIMFEGQAVVQGAMRDLLTDSSLCRITFPEPGHANRQKISDALCEILGHTPKFDRPSRALEQFFLQKIGESRQARQNPENHPVAPDQEDGVAGYLQGEDATAATTDELNRRLRHLTH